MNLRLLAGRALGVAAQLCAAGLLLTSAWLIVRAAQQPPVLYLMVAIVGVRFFGVARTALRYAERLVTHDVALRQVVDLRLRVYAAIDRRAGHLGTTVRRGDLVRRVVADVDAAQDRLLRIRGPWVVAVVTTIVVAGVVVFVEPSAGVVLLAGGIVSMLLVRLTGASATDDGSVTAARGALAAETSGLISAAPDLVVAGATAGTEMLEAAAAVERLERRAAGRAGLAQALVLTCTAVTVAVIVWTSAEVDPVLVGVVVLAPLALAEPWEALADAERLRPAVVAAERRLQDLLDEPPAVREPVSPQPLPRSWRLTLVGVEIGWSDTSLVGAVDLDVEPGSAVVITGPSGVGKSTLALTIARFLEPRAGRIALGDVDVARLSSDDVRSRIGLLGQDEMVFDTTVRENLRIADPSADDTELIEALRRAGLGEWLATTAHGLDTELGEHGSALSGGERQRLCLARLLLGGHRILVVDEPTEHLDEPSAHRLLHDLLALRPNVSLIVISHDPRVVAAIGHEVVLRPHAVTRTPVSTP